MGVWGAGNFTNDEALDYLEAEVVEPLAKQMMKVLNNPHLAEPDEPTSARIMAAVEILALLAEQCNASPPHSGAVEQCKAAYLEIWDAYIDKLGPTPGFKEERRKVIAATFDRLVRAAERKEG
jgi:Domain of unknown function (DUF4259)